MTKKLNIEQAAVIGAGTMGVGIAQVFAQNNIQVTLVDVDFEIIESGLTKLRNTLNKRVQKDKMSQEAVENIFKHIHPSDNYDDLANVDVVVEAVVENMQIKQEIMSKLDAICKPDTILMSNTSTLSPTEIGSATNRPDRVIGFHFMNPAPVMELVEIVPGLTTSEETLNFSKALASLIRKTSVVAIEYPGGITSRIMIAMRNEAIRVYAEGVATAKDVDTAMKKGGNFPIGPLELTDLVGIDVHLFNAESMAQELGPQYNPHPLLKKMVRAGYLGKKSGKGFYDYTKGDEKP